MPRKTLGVKARAETAAQASMRPRPDAAENHRSVAASLWAGSLQ